jgi:hypothetical protein
MLSTRAATWPAHGDWIMEPKSDGFRLLAAIDKRGRVRAWSRRGASLGDRVDSVFDAELGRYPLLVRHRSSPAGHFASTGWLRCPPSRIASTTRGARMTKSHVVAGLCPSVRIGSADSVRIVSRLVAVDGEHLSSAMSPGLLSRAAGVAGL